MTKPKSSLRSKARGEVGAGCGLAARPLAEAGGRRHREAAGVEDRRGERRTDLGEAGAADCNRLMSAMHSDCEIPLAAAAERLAAAGVAEPSREARLLLAAASGLRPLDILAHPHAPLSADARTRFEAFVARRAAREPFAYIIGRKGFWTLELAVSRAVLTPRPETEHVVEAGLAALAGDRPARILDLGTGSGAILLALLAERPAAWGLGVDRSEAALGAAAGNARTLGLASRCALVCADWAAPLAGRFDLVVANPPYVATADIAELAPEIRDHEPRLALDGGPDGLAAYRRIASAMPQLLVPGGTCAFEVGAGQAEAVAALLAKAGLVDLSTRLDLGGIPRVVTARLACP